MKLNVKVNNLKKYKRGKFIRFQFIKLCIVIMENVARIFFTTLIPDVTFDYFESTLLITVLCYKVS